MNRTDKQPNGSINTARRASQDEEPPLPNVRPSHQVTTKSFQLLPKSPFPYPVTKPCKTGNTHTPNGHSPKRQHLQASKPRITLSLSAFPLLPPTPSNAIKTAKYKKQSNTGTSCPLSYINLPASRTNHHHQALPPRTSHHHCTKKLTQNATVIHPHSHSPLTPTPTPTPLLPDPQPSKLSFLPSNACNLTYPSHAGIPTAIDRSICRGVIIIF